MKSTHFLSRDILWPDIWIHDIASQLKYFLKTKQILIKTDI